MGVPTDHWVRSRHILGHPQTSRSPLGPFGGLWPQPQGHRRGTRAWAWDDGRGPMGPWGLGKAELGERESSPSSLAPQSVPWGLWAPQAHTQCCPCLWLQTHSSLASCIRSCCLSLSLLFLISISSDTSQLHKAQREDRWEQEELGLGAPPGSAWLSPPP